MSLTTRERGRGGYTRGEAYIRVGLFRVEKRVTNLGGLYSGELIHGKRGGGVIYGILRYIMIDNKIISQNNQHILDQYYDIIANGVINIS